MRQSNINIGGDKETDDGKPPHNSNANKAIVHLFTYLPDTI